MSARPDWLSDEMLAEMRRLRGSSEGSAMAPGPAYWALDQAVGYHTSHCWTDDLAPSGCWLTEAGHAALAAIEAEEISPLNVDGTLKCEIQPVTLSKEIMSELLHPADGVAYDEGSGTLAEGPGPTRIDISKHGAIRFSKDGAVTPVKESNSSPTLTGWTKDWPTEPGWWWILRPDIFDKARPVIVRSAGRGEHRHLMYVSDGEIIYKMSSANAMFHPMEQPPAPPEGK